MTQKTKEALFAELPQTVVPRLEELQKALSDTLGSDLSALLVFGAAIRGDYRPDKSDLEVLIVLKNAAPEKLKAIANPLTLARYAIRVEAMILTADEIPRAADVYPLLYDDIAQNHTVLVGSDPFAGLTISEHHRRLRIEQELREAQIRLRRVITDSLGQPAAMVAPLVRKVRQLRAPLYALLRMRKVDCSQHIDDVLKAAGKLYAIDVAPLSKIKEAPNAAAETLTKLFEAAVHDVDQMEQNQAS